MEVYSVKDHRGYKSPRTRRTPDDPMPDKSFYSIADRERVVLLGTRAGRSAIQLSFELGVTTRAITRIRRRLREQGLL